MGQGEGREVHRYRRAVKAGRGCGTCYQCQVCTSRCIAKGGGGRMRENGIIDSSWHAVLSGKRCRLAGRLEWAPHLG